MQNAGIKIRCQAPDIDIPENKVKISSYTIEENLYSRLLDIPVMLSPEIRLLTEYEKTTSKQLKRW